MTPEEEQQILLKIVETWRLKEIPEYRGFRCANCQEYKNEAWYHWLNIGGYKLPIHLCNDQCEPLLKTKSLNIDQDKRSYVDRKKFGNSYSFTEKAKQRFREIVAAWPDYRAPKLQTFICDECNQELTLETLPNNKLQRQGYHVWWKMDDGQTLAELHFHKECADELGIKE